MVIVILSVTDKHMIMSSVMGRCRLGDSCTNTRNRSFSHDSDSVGTLAGQTKRESMRNEEMQTNLAQFQKQQWHERDNPPLAHSQYACSAT